MFSNWPCSVEREGRGKARKRGDRHRGEEKKRRGNDWTFVCLAARAHMSKLLCMHLSMDRDMKSYSLYSLTAHSSFL